MIRTTFNSIAISTLLLCTVSCNSKSDDDQEIVYSSANTIISAVSLQENDKVMEHLDSVYFSINQEEGLIFNADSLPYGTRMNGFVPVISTMGASKVELAIPRPNLSDTVISYLENTTDSINFGNGPVKITVTAANGISTRTYTMKINVHQVPTDTLVWRRAQQSNLPSIFAVPEQQRTAATASAIYCLTAAQGRYCIASAINPAATWTSKEVTMPFTPRIESFSATDDALYILDEAGALWRSTDAASWTSTGKRWDNIYGNYGTELWGSMNENGKWSRESYPTNKKQACEEAFPVSGTSQTVNYVFEMSTRPQILITGGETASGQLSKDTWGYDGNSWVCLSAKGLPYALKDAVVVPYFIDSFKPGTIRATRRSALVAMFGQRQNGELNDTVFISKDFGIHWEKAGKELQFSRSFPARTAAQGFVYNETLSSRGLGSLMWRELGTPALPVGARLIAPLSRAATLPESWDCPYIYLFGGVSADGQTYNTLWRGVITAFTFRPII